MRVLVTGATGLVGTAVAQALADAGYEVTGLSRRSRPELPWLQVAVDMGGEDFPAALDQVGPVDAVVHAAASLTMARDAHDVSMVNCLGTHRLLIWARRQAIPRFVYVSSLGVIGAPRLLPVTEDHPVDPPTAYHASKYYGEQLVRVFGAGGMAAASLRIPAPVGPGMPEGRLLTTLVHRALAGQSLVLHGTGSRRQNYVDVRDVAHAVRACLDQPVSGLFNIAGPESVSNLELAEEVVRQTGSNSSIVFSGQPDPGDDMNWVVSCQRAFDCFGYAARHAMNDAVAEVVREARGDSGK